MDVTRHNAAVIKAPSGHCSQPCHVPRTMMAKHIRAVSAMSLSFMDAGIPIAAPHTGECCVNFDCSWFPAGRWTQRHAFGAAPAFILRTTAKAVITHKAALIKAPSGHFNQPCHVPTRTTAMNTRAISTVSLIFMCWITTTNRPLWRAFCALRDARRGVRMAEGEGFEPSRAFTPHTLSRRAP